MYNLCGRTVQFRRFDYSIWAVALFNSKRSGCSTLAEYSIEKFLVGLDYEKIKAIPEFVEARNILSQIMEIVATEIASNWNDPRYSRELAEE